MFSDKFKKYTKIINVDDLSDFPKENFITDLVNKMQKDFEDMYYEFLTENGYKIDKPYKMEQIEAIKNDLASKDKFVDYLEYTVFSENCEQAYHYIKPFFNSISNPISEETRNELIARWKKENDKNKQ